MIYYIYIKRRATLAVTKLYFLFLIEGCVYIDYIKKLTDVLIKLT